MAASLLGASVSRYLGGAPHDLSGKRGVMSQFWLVRRGRHVIATLHEVVGMEYNNTIEVAEDAVVESPRAHSITTQRLTALWTPLGLSSRPDQFGLRRHRIQA